MGMALLVPLIVALTSGLGFLTYKHPNFGRKITWYIILALLGIAISAKSYEQGFYKAQSKSFEIFLKRVKNVDKDSTSIIENFRKYDALEKSLKNDFDDFHAINQNLWFLLL